MRVAVYAVDSHGECVLWSSCAAMSNKVFESGTVLDRRSSRPGKEGLFDRNIFSAPRRT